MLYSNTPNMVNDLPEQVPGAVVTTSDPYAVQSPSELQQSRTPRSLYPNTVGMRDEAGEAPAPAPDEAAAPQPQDPAVANYTFDLPPGAQLAETDLAELKALAVQSKLEPATTSRLVALHAQALAARERAQVDAEARAVAAWAEQVRASPEWTAPGRAEAVAAVRELAPPSARALLDGSLGNHPGMVALVVALGKELRRLRGGGSGPYNATPGMRP
jgi:hypothetical protein